MKSSDVMIACRYLAVVIDRKTRQDLLEPAEFITEFHFINIDSGYYSDQSYTARHRFRADIETKIKHSPVIRRKLEGKDWVVDVLWLGTVDPAHEKYVDK